MPAQGMAPSGSSGGSGISPLAAKKSSAGTIHLISQKALRLF
jgi:hypothetical protein